MKICLVHDDFLQTGGAESLFATIAQLYPDAPIYTSVVDWQKLPQSIDPQRIKTSFIQKIPLSKKFYKLLLPMYPLAFESFNFDNFDLVISSTTRFAKSIITKPKTIHVSYINSIPRFLWDKQSQTNYLPSSIRFILGPFFNWLRRWDATSSSRVDYYIANSENVAEKIKQICKRNAIVVYPYASTKYFTPAKIHNWQLKEKNYFLIVTRLVKWKKVDVAIRAAADLALNLFIVGDGPDKMRLEKIAQGAKNIHFLGKVTAEKLRELYRNSQALIVTQQEDFGIAAVEAQSCGVVVIAYAAGGVVEIVKDNKTGLLFNKQTKESLKDAIQRLPSIKWSIYQNRQNALKFSKSVFIKEFKQVIASYAKNQQA